MHANKFLAHFSVARAHKAIKSLIWSPHKNPLGRRVLAAILLCSTCLAFLATGLQLLFEYQHDVSAIELRMDEIERSHLDSIGASMWSMDDQQTHKQLEGLVNLPDVTFAQLKDPTGKTLMQVGSPTDSKAITREMPIRYIAERGAEQKIELGTLIVTATLGRIYQDLRNKAFVILVTQTTKTTIVAIFALFIFNRLVSRHLSSLAAYALKLDFGNMAEALKLFRKMPKHPDELDIVVSAVNEMARSIKRDFDEMNMVIRRLNIEIGERKLAERSARENEDRYRQVVEMSPDAIMIERDGKIVFVNSGTLKLLGAADASQLMGTSMSDFVPSEWLDIMQEQVQKPAAESELRPFEGKMIRFDGTTVDVEVSRAVLQYAGEPAIQTFAHDITKHKHYEEQLRKQALHDALTGLPNRTLLMDRLEQAIAVADQLKTSVFVLFFDLDRFKYVNDTLGHGAGDELLTTMTQRMSECVRKHDTLARLGGDEFVLVMGNVIDEGAAFSIVQEMIDQIRQPMMLGIQEVVITCSVGVSVYPKDAQDPMTLLKYADTAMYRAKEQGRNGLRRYHAEMHARVNEHLVMEARLRRALEREELLLYYQPQLSLRTGKIIGVEALIRWQHPELGLVLPARFIALAEETGLITSIGEWVTRSACMQAKAWQDAGLPPIRVSVNLSAQQVVRPHLELDVQRALQDAGLAPEYLELEITESMSMDDPELMVSLLNKLNTMGVSIAIDDFGTGYSNLAYLQRFPVDRLKLDSSFVRNITRNTGDARLANAIIGMAHSLNLTVIAEGVEEPGQLAQLVTHGCDEIQGHYFSPPVSADEFAKILREGRNLDLDLELA